MNFDRETLTELALEGIDAVHDMDVTHADYARSIADTILAAMPAQQVADDAEHLRALLARVQDAVTNEPCNMRSRAAVAAILEDV